MKGPVVFLLVVCLADSVTLTENNINSQEPTSTIKMVEVDAGSTTKATSTTAPAPRTPTSVTATSTVSKAMTTASATTTKSTETPQSTTSNPTTASSTITPAHTTSRTTITTTIATTIAPCQNGGTHDGIKCICTANYYGPKCEFHVDEIPVELETVPLTLEVQVKITNRNYSDNLLDTSSEEYKDLESDFKEEMGRVYEKVPGYRGVKILSLRKGSIIVDHEVIIEAKIMNNVSAINSVVQNLTEVVREQLFDFSSTNQTCKENSTICFTAPSDPILNTNVQFSEEDYCRSIAGPLYADYYYPNTTTGKLTCMTRCSKESASFIDCNYGVCRISVRGPQCNCNDLSTYWYTDDFCRSRIHKGEAGLGIALAVVLLFSAVLAIFLFKAKWKKTPEIRMPGQKKGFPSFSRVSGHFGTVAVPETDPGVVDVNEGS